MSAWEIVVELDIRTPVTGASGGLRDWPWSVVRWLFGGGDEDREPESSPRVGGPVPEHLHQPRDRGGGRRDRPDGGSAAGLEGLRPRAARGDRPSDGAADRRRPVPSTSWRPAWSRTGCLPLREEHYAPQEAYLDHLAKLIEAIGRAGESVLVGRGAGFMLPARDDALDPDHRPAARPGRSPGRADGRVGPHRPAGGPGPRPPPRPVRPHDAPDGLGRPAQLRPGARLVQPGPGHRRRGHRPGRRGRPAGSSSVPAPARGP